MKLPRSLLTDLVTGVVLSLIFCSLLISQIMAGGVGESISFAEFLSTPSNLLFCIFMTSLILAAWWMRGINNRTVLFCWAIMYAFNYIIFLMIYEYFLHEFKNIYALSVAGLIAGLPILLLIRYRIRITIFVCKRLWKLNLFRAALGRYVSSARLTDFEYNMRTALYAAFTIEFLYSLYLISYGLLNQIPYHGNITAHMLQHKHWTPYDLYFLLLDIVTLFYILIIGFHLYRDHKTPDAFCYGMSDKERRDASLRIMEKHHKQAKEDKNRNKRDQ